MNYAEWWGPHWHWYGIMPFLFMILMFVLVAVMFRRSRNMRWGPENRTGWMPFPCWVSGQDPMLGWGPETAQQILDRRYASGEITKEQYERMKRDIEPSQKQEV